MSKEKLYAALGIMIDSIARDRVEVKGRSKYKKELRKQLFDLFKVESENELRQFCDENGLIFESLDSAKYLDRLLLTKFLRYIEMIMAVEFGIEVELPDKNKRSTSDMNLTDYLNHINETSTNKQRPSDNN